MQVSLPTHRASLSDSQPRRLGTITALTALTTA